MKLNNRQDCLSLTTIFFDSSKSFTGEAQYSRSFSSRPDESGSGLRCILPLTPPSNPPLPRGDEGGCLSDYRQKNPLKYNAPPVYAISDVAQASPAYRWLRDKDGFTLLELLIGITLSVIVLLILFAGMRLGYRSQEKGIEREEISQRMRILGDRITWLLRGAYPYTVKKPDGKTVYFMGESDSLGFVTTSVYNNAEGPEDRAGLKWVLISADSDGLKIKENVYFLEDVLEDKGGKTYIFDPSVKDIEFEYLDISEEDKEGTWRSDWEPKDKDYLPSAVRVKMVFEYNNKEILMPELVVKIEAIKKVD